MCISDMRAPELKLLLYIFFIRATSYTLARDKSAVLCKNRAKKCLN